MDYNIHAHLVMSNVMMMIIFSSECCRVINNQSDHRAFQLEWFYCLFYDFKKKKKKDPIFYSLLYATLTWVLGKFSNYQWVTHGLVDSFCWASTKSNKIKLIPFLFGYTKYVYIWRGQNKWWKQGPNVSDSHQ